MFVVVCVFVDESESRLDSHIARTSQTHKRITTLANVENRCGSVLLSPWEQNDCRSSKCERFSTWSLKVWKLDNWKMWTLDILQVGQSTSWSCWYPTAARAYLRETHRSVIRMPGSVSKFDTFKQSTVQTYNSSKLWSSSHPTLQTFKRSAFEDVPLIHS